MNTAVAEKKPQTETLPVAPVMHETPEEAALQALEQGEPSGVFERVELEAASQEAALGKLAETKQEDADMAPEETVALHQEKDTIQKELDSELENLRAEFGEILGETSWRKAETKAVSIVDLQEPPRIDATKYQPNAGAVEIVKQKVIRLGGETPALATAETKTPEAWKADAELANQETASVSAEADEAHQAMKTFEQDYPKPHSALVEKYQTYLQTRVAEAEVRHEYMEMRQEHLALLADISEREQQTEQLRTTEQKTKGELDGASAKLKTKNQQYDAAMGTWNDLQGKQMRKEPLTAVEQKKYSHVAETVQLLEKERSGLMPLVKKLEQGYREIVSAREEGETFLQQAGNRLTELDRSMEKTQHALETLRAVYERSAQEYTTAYAAAQEKPVTKDEEEEKEAETPAEEPYVLGVDVATLPVEKPYVMGERAFGSFGGKAWRKEKRLVRFARFLKNRKHIGIGMAALGLFGVKRAMNGALDFTDTVLGHMISFIKSPTQFLQKFKGEFDARTKRQGGFSGFASTVSWALFGGPEEAVEQRETKEQRKQREDALEEKKRKVAA